MKFINFIVFLICVLLCLITWYFYASFTDVHISNDLHDVTFKIRNIFNDLDSNDDGFLDINEFSTLENNYKIFQFQIQRENFHYEIQEFPHLPTKLDEQIIYIEAAFKPLVLTSMKKDFSNIPKDELGSLAGLINWKTPHKTGHPFGSKSFSVFLPENTSPKVGSPWWIIKPQLDKYSHPVSSQRHFPPLVEKKYHLLFALLSLFHPHLFLLTRFAPQGTAAVIRAINNEFYDIVFRIHAEFQLNEPPLHPFWFTPSQFSGQIIINKDSSVIKYFHLLVPSRKLNVDMEWMNGPTESSMEVDIGHVPQMSLESVAVSAAHKSKQGSNQNLSSIEWDEEISVEEALKYIELKFFPFNEDYKNLNPQSKNYKLASVCLEHYEFPVESIIFFSNGSVIHHINANTLLYLNEEMGTFIPSVQDPVEKRYQDFLEFGILKSKNVNNHKKEL